MRTSIPRVVYLALALHAALLLTYSTMFPLYRPPDETSHLDMVLAAKNQQGWPAERFTSQRTVASYEPAGFVRRVVTPLSEESAVPRGQRPTFEELAPEEATEFSNPAAQHPPLYYTVSATALLVVNTLVPLSYDWSFDQVVLFVRILNILMVLPLPLLMYRTAQRVLADERVAVAVSFVPLALPQFTHIGASVNNDNLLNLLLAAMALQLARVALGDSGRRDAVLIGAVAGAALLTKGFALLVFPWITAAYVLGEGGFSSLTRVAPGVRRALPALAIAGVIGGWWWFRNVLLLGTVQPLGRERNQLPADELPGIEGWITSVPVLLVQRFWGSFSRYDVSIPPLFIVVAAIIALTGAVLWFVSRPRGQPLRITHVIALLNLPVVATLGIMLYGSLQVYRLDGDIAGIQGRYLFVGMTGLALLVLGGWARVVRGRGLLLGVLVVGGVLHLVAASRVVAYFWGREGPDDPIDSVNGWLAWAPWPGVLVVTVWCAVVGLAVALVFATLADPEVRRSPAVAVATNGGRATRTGGGRGG